MLQCMGPKAMSEILHIFRLTEDPASILLLRVNHISMCKVSSARRKCAAEQKALPPELSQEQPVEWMCPWPRVISLKVAASREELELQYFNDDVKATQSWPC